MLLAITAWPGTIGLAQPDKPDVITVRGTVRYSAQYEVYGILTADGKKYQPLKLPSAYRHDGLAVIVEGKVRRDLIGARMWGTALEIGKIYQADLYIAPHEPEAIGLLVKRMAAFNNGDLTALQQIDVVARGLTPAQFTDWTSGYGNFQLRYVELSVTTEKHIEGFCLYSRDKTNGFALSGNTQYALMQFTLNKLAGEWKFIATAPYDPTAGGEDRDSYIGELIKRGVKKYGRENLADWPG